MSLHPHRLHLSHLNVKKLMKGDNTLIKHDQMDKGQHVVYLGTTKSKRLHKAHKSGKGMKLSLSPKEKEHSIKHGEGFKEFVAGAKKIFNEVVKPELRKNAHHAISKHAEKIEHNVEKALAPIVGKTSAKHASKTIKPALHKGVEHLLGDKKGHKKEMVEGEVGSLFSEEGEGVRAYYYNGKKKNNILLEKMPTHKKRGRPKKTEGGKISLGDVVKGYKKYVKPVVGPAIRKGLTKAIKVGAPVLATAVGQPELAPLASGLADQYAESAVNKLGDVTGAFGIHHKEHAKRYNKTKPAVISDTHSNFLNPLHPAMNPALPPPDMSVIHGGSFRPAGYGISHHKRIYR